MNDFRKKRLELKLSQAEAAELMGRSLSTVKKWDGGFVKRDLKEEAINLQLRYYALLN